MKDSTEAERGGNSSNSLRLEAAVLIAGLVAFVLINLVSADKSPAVWCDEVMYQDPAVNLYQGHGFTSGAWYAQGMDKYWAGNVPLYPFVLYGWLELFGFSLLSVRSFHYVAISFAMLTAWVAIRRLNLIPSPLPRLVFCLLVCLSSASTFVFRNARPESLCMLFAALALLACSFRILWLRIFLLAVSGVLLIWTGLQMAVYAGLMSGLIWLFGSRRFRVEVLSLCLGCALGMLLLFFFYDGHGVWPDFLASIRRHTIANKGVNYEIIPGSQTNLGAKLKHLPVIYFDFSFIPILALALWMGWRLFRSEFLRWRSPLPFGILAAFVVPLGLYVIGVFPLYYFWMAFFPLALGLCAEIDHFYATNRSPMARVAVFAMVGLACLFGLPRRLVVASHEWRARSYGPVMAFAAPYVPGSKLIYSEFAAYYAAKQFAAQVVLPPYLSRLDEGEKARLSVAIIQQGDAASLARLFGGEWRDTGAALTPPTGSHLIGFRENLDSRCYNLKIFVRSESTRQ
ncbi:MAG: hypothetical protein JWR26_4636 [Pedosphaera sp.]|nr:hypothetical protein [Pedosphaera sp.]